MTAATYADRIRGITTSEAIKAPVDVATTANITLSGAQTIDGVAVTTGDRVLVRSQTTTTENGIYDVATTAWTRALDFNGTGDAIEGTLIWVRSGDTYADRFFQLTSTDDPIVFGTSAITFGNGIPTTDQLQDGTINWADGVGTADAITATYSPEVTSLSDGQLCFVRATSANATTTPTFSPNGITAHTIVKNGGQALVAGDIFGDGHELILRYNLANTRWELMNPGVTISAFVKTLLDDATAAAFSATLGLGTGDSPQFTAVNVGHATDTTITRVSAGVIAVEGGTVPTINVSNTYTAPQRADLGTVTDGTLDLNASQSWIYTPGGADTLEFTNEAAGQSGIIFLTNGSNYAIALGAECMGPTGMATAISVTGEHWISYGVEAAGGGADTVKLSYVTVV